MRSIAHCLTILTLLLVFNQAFSQAPDPTSCDNSGVPLFTPSNATDRIGDNISTVDQNSNFIGTVNGIDLGGGNVVDVTDGTEYCDELGVAGSPTGLGEGPDLLISIPVDENKRFSCQPATLTITLRGDFNNSQEVAYIVNECDIIIGQSTTTGLPETDKCDVIFPLQVVISAADIVEAAADGVIEFEVRTNGTPTNTCCQGSQVDATCGGGSAVDCDGDGFDDGNCIALSSFIWPIETLAFGGTLNTTNEVVCDGEAINIDVLQDLKFPDPRGGGDGDDETGTYHLDFYYGGGPDAPNPYDDNLSGTPGDVVNAYTVSNFGSNPRVTIENNGGVGIQDHSNTNAPLASGGGNLPSNTLIEVLGSIWSDNNVEPSAAGFCTGEIIGCTYTTSYASFVLLDPISATSLCESCNAGPGDDTNIGVVTISGFDGGLPDYDDSLYDLQATGGTLSSTTADVGGSVTLTLDEGQHSWSVTIIDEEGCEFFLSGTCGIETEPTITMPSYTCVDAGPFAVSVSPTGGALTGPGISGTTFDPLTAGEGMHTITYTITESGCSSTVTQLINVDNCSGCSDCGTPIICNLGYTTTNNNWNIDNEGAGTNTLDDAGAGSLCGRSIGTTDLCLFNVFIEKCGDVDLIAKFNDPTLDPNDIDVYAWGPFNGLPDCINDLTPGNNVVCNPDVATPDGVPIEIECAVEGQFYIVGVADFTGNGGGNSVFIGQTNTSDPGAGSILGCTVPEPIQTADDVSVCENDVITLTLRSDNIPFTCGGNVAIYSDPMGMTLVGNSGTLTLSAGDYDYYAACLPAAGTCDCDTTFIPVNIFVDDLVTIPTSTSINDGCGDYDQTISSTAFYTRDALFPNSDDGGTFSVSTVNAITTGASITNLGNEEVSVNGAGCFAVTYSIPASQCGGPSMSTVNIFRGIEPEPNFNIQNQICLASDADTDAVTIMPTINSSGTDYDNLVTRNWTISGPAGASIDATSGEVEITSTGTYTVTLTESITNAVCGTIAGGTCSEDYSVQIVAQSGESLDATFTASDLTPCLNTDVTLTPTVTGGVFSGFGVTDNGDGTGATFNQSSAGQYIVTYNIESTNGCNNSYSLLLTVDEQPPVITCPSVLTLQCGIASNNTSINNWLGTVSGTDDCGTPTMTNELISTTSTCGDSETRLYQFTATDASGNTSTCLASVIIEDTTAPSVMIPDALEIECGDLSSVVAWLASATATNTCGEVTITNNYSSDGYILACGNTG